MKALIIGGTGFLGKAIAGRYLQADYEVWITYKNNPENTLQRAKPIHIDALKDLANDFDVVVLCAGNHALSDADLVDVNVTLTRRASKQFSSARLVFVSSVAVYGAHSDVINEGSPSNEPSPYGLAKLAGEAAAAEHASFSIVRPTYLYGPGMSKNSFLPIILDKAVNEKLITLYGKGERLQDYLHVQDAAALCYAAGDALDNQTYLGATGVSQTNTEIAEYIASLIPGCRIEYSGDDSTYGFQFDPGRTKSKLEWKPEQDLKQTLGMMLS